MNATRTRSTWPTALVLVGILITASTAWAGEIGARLVSVQGNVEVSGPSTATWTAARLDRVLHAGEAVRTGSRSSAVLDLDGGRITLYETTLLTIPQSATTVSTNAPNPFRHPLLDQGRALFNIAPHQTPMGFSVRTPMLVAGVKGTIFEVVATSGEHAVYVWEGAVEVQSLRDPTDMQMVFAGEHTLMDGHRLIPHAPIPDGRDRPTDARRDALPPSAPTPLPLHEDSLITERQTEPTPPTVAASESDRDPLTASTSGLLSNFDDPFDGWRDADQAAIDLVSRSLTEVQTVISSASGELRLAIPSISSSTSVTSTSLSSSTTNLTSTVSSVTDPLTSTVSSLTTPLTSTVSSVTAPLTSTVSSLTAPVTSAVSSVTAPVMNTVSSVTAPVSSTVATATTTTTGSSSGSSCSLLCGVTNLLGF